MAKAKVRSATDADGDPSLNIECRHGSVCVTMGWPKLTAGYNNVTLLISQDHPLQAGEDPAKVAEKLIDSQMKFLTKHRDRVFGELHAYAAEKGEELKRGLKNSDR